MNLENVLVFMLGFFSCAFLFFSFGSGLEVPFKTGLAVLDGGVLDAPSDWVESENIIILGDKVILKIDGATLSSYVDSGSMVPTLDKGANGIRIVPDDKDDIEVGDIVSFRIGGLLVVHRVVEKGIDEDGVYFAMKGDANLIGDGKIRFEDIEYVTIGIIY
jgi:signal peptidase I